MIPLITGNETIEEKLFEVPKKCLNYYGSDPSIEKAVIVLWERLRMLAPYHALQLSRAVREDAELVVEIDQSNASEAYTITIESAQIRILSGGYEGVTAALTTIYWKFRDGDEICNCGFLSDVPAYLYRGVLLDCSRHFFAVDTIKSMIEQCSLRKLNKIHWHLSDDQGYRIESVRFPKLNQIGSCRIEPDGSNYGGYYTHREISEIIEYARVRGMEVIPEIDLPGHVSSLIASYPDLSCTGEPMNVPTQSGIHTRILCAGKDETLSFVYQLLDEVIPLFPSQYFHIGGDEAPKVQWQNCPCCQERIQQEQLADEEDLQSWFTERILDYLKSKNKTGICWNEALKSGKLNGDTLIQYWDEEDAGEDYCKVLLSGSRGYIDSYAAARYFDFIPALVPLRMAFSMEPKLRCGVNIVSENLLGFEAGLWSESISDQKTLERMAFPRLLAVAERAWNTQTTYDDFLERCAHELKWLEEDKIAYFSIAQADPEGQEQKRQICEYWQARFLARKSGGEAAKRRLYQLMQLKLMELYSPEEIEEIIRLSDRHEERSI